MNPQDKSAETGRPPRFVIWTPRDAFLLLALATFALGTVTESMLGTAGLLEGLLKKALDAFVLAALLGWISETDRFQNFFERRLQQVIEDSDRRMTTTFHDAIDTDWITRASDPAALRKLTDSTLLHQMESAVQQAYFPSPVPADVETLLTALGKKQRDLTLFRTNYIRHLKYSHVDTKPELYALRSEVNFEFKNFGSSAELVVQSLNESCPLIGGIRPQDLYTVDLVELSGKACPEALAPTTEVQDGRVAFRSKLEFEVPVAVSGVPSVSVRKISRATFPKSHPWVLTVWRPVHRAAISVELPEDVVPSLYVFGVGGSEPVTDPLAPKVSTKTFYMWNFDGWLLPRHGMIMTFHPRAEMSGGD